MRPYWLRGMAVVMVTGFALIGTACGGAGDESDSQGLSDGGGDEIKVIASEFQFQPSSLSVGAGESTLELENAGRQEHDFLIEGVDDPSAHHLIHAMPGEAASGDYDLEAGTYTFYCSVPGHRESGMEGTLRVT